MSMSIREVSLAIEGKDQALQRDYNLMFLASYNAVGVVNGGKKFKIIDPFDVAEKERSKHRGTKEERDATIEFLKSFNK